MLSEKAAPTVTTVCGEIPSDELGVTLMHEHIFINLVREYRHVGLLNDVPLAIEELCAFRSSGGGTVIDVTSIGLGTYPERLKAVAESTGLNIVACTGLYREQYHDKEWVSRRSVDDLAAFFVREIEEGIAGSQVRAGIIGEICCDEWITAADERNFRAAARAHKITNVSITTHAAGWPVGNSQLDILEQEGVDPQRVIIGHCDMVASVEWTTVNDVMDYHCSLASRGAFVQFDNLGKYGEFGARRRLDYVCNMLEKGFGDKILLSQDVHFTSDLRAYGGPGYTYVVQEFSQALLDRGVSQDELRRILIDNPRAALTGIVQPTGRA